MTLPILPERDPVEYVPEGMREIEVGMKVRWRISGECEYRCGDCGDDLHLCGPRGEGVITSIFELPFDGFEPPTRCKTPATGCGGFSVGHEGHRFFVATDRDDRYLGFCAARWELVIEEETERN